MCFFFCIAGPVGEESEHLGDPDRLRRHCGSACTASPHHCVDSPLRRQPVSTTTLGINKISSLLLSYVDRCSPVRHLPSETDTVQGMQIFAYLWPYLFRIVHVFWIAHGCVDGLVSLFCSDPRRSFGTTSLLLSGYTLSLLGRVSGEQRGGATEILSRIRVEHGN
jgi:hypothetical protein